MGKVRLPQIFKTNIRPDIIKKDVIVIRSHKVQPQGRDPMAGKRTTAESWGVGHGISRVPRLRQMRRAAFAPGTVGGRIAHPPVAEKKIRKHIPKKEKRLALSSAIAATGSKEWVTKRGHIVDDVPDFPLVVSEDIERVSHSKELRAVFMNLGLWADIFRVKDSIKNRAGKGKRRGRRKKTGVGPLIVISKNEGIMESARNFPGVDVFKVGDLNTSILSPGANPGRLTLWSRSTIEELKNLHGRETQ